MKNSGAHHRSISVPRRALIVQRVLVDGWSSAKAAEVFGVSQHVVDAWVADYLRHGMASLRRASDKTRTAKIVDLVVLQPIRGAARTFARGMRRFFVRDRPAQPLPLQRSNDDRRGGE